MNKFSLTNHAALVTGSSQGIGFAAGSALREDGATVLFHGLQARPDNIPTDSGYVPVRPWSDAVTAEITTPHNNIRAAILFIMGLTRK